ncbi:MAG: IS607 family element transposase accessory protein TnpB [Acidobacteriota bacterium]|nr:IS607 family element transposase accessory protein TnpB [Acidobacteriota bacterium]MDE3093984.1 IS607 family element transposase accessory protein TnpB [Acidobacteriota bacterium]MDE3147753.1 IS607 family element transposase accessory protein TnpB [Acidobacteriota bacterium]
MPRRYCPPEGQIVQAFTFALDPTVEQAAHIARFFGARRFAFNWTLERIKCDLERYRETGESRPAPSFYALRKRWNGEKNAVCVNDTTGEVWWPEVSKEVFADGVKGATDAYWRWQQSRSGQIAGRPVGFPRFKKRGKDRDRFSFTTGVMRLEPDRRHLSLPVLGTLRTLENTRRLERLISLGRAKVLSVTVSRQGEHIIAAVRVSVARPQQSGVAQPGSVVGVDVGVRRLATVATASEVIDELANPHALERRLSELRRLQRQRCRRTPGSRQYRETATKITRLHAEVAHLRRHTIHVFTTHLAKTHGVVVVEGLDAASLLQQTGLPGAKSRRRDLSDAAMGEIRRQLRYKCPWYGSTLVEADRFFPSSKTCHDCGHVQDIGWSEHWTCEECSSSHQRDDNAAINLARWASLGSVGAPVKRGAEHQTEPHSAAGDDTRKGGPAPVGPNNSVRSAA